MKRLLTILFLLVFSYLSAFAAVGSAPLSPAGGAHPAVTQPAHKVSAIHRKKHRRRRRRHLRRRIRRLRHRRVKVKTSPAQTSPSQASPLEK